MRFIFFICFFIFSFKSFSQSFVHELEAPLNVAFDGNQQSLRAGQQVVLETPINSLLQETVEIREAYSSQDRVASISESEFLLAVSEQIEEQVDLVAPSGDSLVTFYNGGRFAFISLHDEADDPYVGLVEINEEGQILDELGEVAESDYPIYRINANEYNRLSLRHQFRRLNDNGLNPIPPCVPVFMATEDTVRPVARPVSPYAPAISLIPEPRPANLNTSLSSAASDSTPYDLLMDRRSEIRSSGECESRRRNYEAQLMQDTDWAGLTLHERADKILEVAESSLEAIIEASNETGRNQATQGSPYRSWVNPHYIDPLVTPEMMTCIAFHETRGQLNFIAHNFSYCYRDMTSTSHGLAMTTLRSFRQLLNFSDGNQLPLLTENARRYEGMGTTEFHRAFSDDPHMQLEVGMRHLNHLIKHQRVSSPRASDDTIIQRGVAAYDRDRQSSYMSHFNACFSCMQRGESASNCYREVYE